MKNIWYQQQNTLVLIIYGTNILGLAVYLFKNLLHLVLKMNKL